MLGSRNGSGRANDYCLCFRLTCFISFFIVSYLYYKYRAKLYPWNGLFIPFMKAVK